MFIFATLLLIGQGIQSIGTLTSVNSYALLLIGKTIYGLGCESMSITLSNNLKY